VSQTNALGYREITTGTGGFDGGVWPAPPQLERPFVQLIIEVDDVNAYITKAESLGAVTIVPRSVLPDGDTMAVLHDPAGMPFAICTRTPRATP
jgi:predicted enzyme related to lactoylglutathione lyase